MSKGEHTNLVSKVILKPQRSSGLNSILEWHNYLVKTKFQTFFLTSIVSSLVGALLLLLQERPDVDGRGWKGWPPVDVDAGDVDLRRVLDDRHLRLNHLLGVTPVMLVVGVAAAHAAAQHAQHDQRGQHLSGFCWNKKVQTDILRKNSPKRIKLFNSGTLKTAV